MTAHLRRDAVYRAAVQPAVGRGSGGIPPAPLFF